MKIKKYTEVREHFKHGDKVWACEFNYTHTKDSNYLHQKPVFGMLMAGSNQAGIDRIMERHPGYTGINYFIPFKKNGKDLAWSKAVQMSSRCYATTEEECIELFNALIDDEIEKHYDIINILKSKIIRK